MSKHGILTHWEAKLLPCQHGQTTRRSNGRIGVIKYLTIFYLGIQVGLLYTTTSTSNSYDSSIQASLIAMPAPLQRINDASVSVVSSPQSLSKEACAVLTTKLTKEDVAVSHCSRDWPIQFTFTKAMILLVIPYLKLDSGQHSKWQIYAKPWVMSNFASKMRLPPNDVVFLDIGANVLGSYSLSMASYG